MKKPLPKKAAKQKREAALDDLSAALAAIHAVLGPLPPEARRRVLKAAAILLEIPFPEGA